jgi:4-diphosphocytidyl-2C-methyl-D-erythritol kinase
MLECIAIFSPSLGKREEDSANQSLYFYPAVDLHISTGKIFNLNEQIESERKIFSTKIEEMENNFQNTDNNKLQMLQKTITNLNVEIRDLKIKNKELENKLLEQPKESDFTKARFHGSSNLNDDLYK